MRASAAGEAGIPKTGLPQPPAQNFRFFKRLSARSPKKMHSFRPSAPWTRWNASIPRLDAVRSSVPRTRAHWWRSFFLGIAIGIAIAVGIGKPSAKLSGWRWQTENVPVWPLERVPDRAGRFSHHAFRWPPAPTSKPFSASTAQSAPTTGDAHRDAAPTAQGQESALIVWEHNTPAGNAADKGPSIPDPHPAVLFSGVRRSLRGTGVYARRLPAPRGAPSPRRGGYGESDHSAADASSRNRALPASTGAPSLSTFPPAR